jgi:hypothetical protein
MTPLSSLYPSLYYFLTNFIRFFLIPLLPVFLFIMLKVPLIPDLSFVGPLSPQVPFAMKVWEEA